MTRIILFGGHGRVALLAHPLFADRGDEVTAVIRNPEHADDVRAAGAEPLVADVESLDLAALTELVAGHDVVVWSAGAGGGDPARTLAVDRDAAIRTMDAALAAGVRRYVMVSYFGAAADHGVDPSNSFFTYAEAKADADDHLRATGLDWTVLGPSGLTFDEPTGRIDTFPADASSSSQTVSRADVAAVVVETVHAPHTVGRTIWFNSGETPIAAALR